MTQTATQLNRDEYARQFSLLDASGTGVIITRTREPFRAADTLRSYTVANNTMENPRIYKSWSMTTGWSTYNLSDPNAMPHRDGVVGLVQALVAINGTPQTANNRNAASSEEAFEDGVYVVMWPHQMFKNLPQVTQILAEYSQEFSQVHKRLVLLIPPEAEIPSELNDLVYYLDFDPPSGAELAESLKCVTDNMPTEDLRPAFSDEDVELIVNAGLGITEAEFEGAIGLSIVKNRNELPDLPPETVVRDVMVAKTEAVKRSEVLETMAPEDMGNVGGLDNLKAWIERKSKVMGSEAREAGVDSPKGCALVGPPGTGKSLAAKAIAHTLQVPLIRFDVGRVFNSLVGSSEQRVRAALKMLDSMAPCVCLLDELDKGFEGSNSGGGDGGTGKRVLGTILTHMQESKSGIFWVATMNRTQGMPPELLRKGRLDEVFSVTVPDESERLEVIQIHLRRRGFDPSKVKKLSDAVDNSYGYVAAELEAAVKEAVEIAFVEKEALTGPSILEQLNEMKPLSEAFKDEFQAMREWAENNARPASASAAAAKKKERTDKAKSATVRTRNRTGKALGNKGRVVSLEGLDQQ